MEVNLENILKKIEDFFQYQSELNVPIYLPEKFLEIINQQIKLNTQFIDSFLSKISEPFVGAKSLSELDSLINKCVKCSLGNLRKNFVFGVGNPNADIVFVGEAPGADEDEQGEPFVGKAGKLLTETLSTLGFRRDEVYICNILKCRPPNNRDPLPAEVEKCEPYLLKQLSLIKPKIIVALGRIAGNTLLKKNETLSNLRRNIFNYYDIPFFVTFHPAAILRNPNWKRDFEKDLEIMKEFYLSLAEKKKVL